MNHIKSILGTLIIGLFFNNVLYAGWTPPVSLSSQLSNTPSLAVDGLGNAIALWQAYDGEKYTVQYATFPAGGAWSSAETLSSAGINLQSPKVCMDRMGNAVAVWSEFNGTHSIIQSSSLPFGGIWSPHVTISNLGENADSPNLAMDSYGNVMNAVAVWRRFNGFNFIAQSARLNHGGLWSPAVNVTPSGSDALIPNVAVDPSGNRAMTWCKYDEGNFTAHFCFGFYGRNWGPNELVSSSGSTASSSTLAIDGAGNSLLIWNQFNGTQFVVEAAIMPLGGSESVSTVISTPGQNSFSPRVSMNSSGDAIVAWIGYNGTNYIGQASLLSGGTWTAPINLSSATSNVGCITATIDQIGNALVMWDENDGITSSVYSASLPSGGQWNPSQMVSLTGNNAYEPKVGMDANGNAVAIWLEESGAIEILKASSLPFGS